VDQANINSSRTQRRPNQHPRGVPEPGYRNGRDGRVKLRVCHSGVASASQTKSRTIFDRGRYGVYAYGQLMAGAAVRPMRWENDRSASRSQHVLLNE